MNQSNRSRWVRCKYPGPSNWGIVSCKAFECKGVSLGVVGILYAFYRDCLMIKPQTSGYLKEYKSFEFTVRWYVRLHHAENFNAQNNQEFPNECLLWMFSRITNLSLNLNVDVFESLLKNDGNLACAYDVEELWKRCMQNSRARCYQAKFRCVYHVKQRNGDITFQDTFLWSLLIVCTKIGAPESSKGWNGERSHWLKKDCRKWSAGKKNWELEKRRKWGRQGVELERVVKVIGRKELWVFFTQFIRAPSLTFFFSVMRIMSAMER